MSSARSGGFLLVCPSHKAQHHLCVVRTSIAMWFDCVYYLCEAPHVPFMACPKVYEMASLFFVGKLSLKTISHADTCELRW